MTPRQKRKRHAAGQRRYAKSRPPGYYTWKGMMRRCTCINHEWYHLYGGRGIKVCARWSEPRIGFKNFLVDLGWQPSPEFHLDRIDPDGDYCLENCRWLHRAENCSRVRRPSRKEKDDLPI